MRVFCQVVAKLGEDHLRAAVFTRFSLRGFVWRLCTRVHFRVAGLRVDFLMSWNVCCLVRAIFFSSLLHAY